MRKKRNDVQVFNTVNILIAPNKKYYNGEQSPAVITQSYGFPASS